LAVNAREPAHALNTRADANRRHFHHERIAWSDGATKARVINPAEEDEFFITVLKLAERINGSHLGHRFNDKHAGHDGRSRKMALEERLVDGDLLDADDALARHKLCDAIYEQKGITMRQDILYSARVVNGHNVNKEKVKR
jgi:hypothetical protein